MPISQLRTTARKDLARFGKKVLGRVGCRDTDLIDLTENCVHVQRKMTKPELRAVNYDLLSPEMARFR